MTKGQRSQVLASIANKHDPKLMDEAMRVQFSDIHKAEGKYQRDSHHGKGGRDQRGYAYAAEQEYDEDDRRDGTWDETADAEDEDYEYDDGGMTDLEYELNALRDDVEACDEAAEEQMALLSECLACEQSA